MGMPAKHCVHGLFKAFGSAGIEYPFVRARVYVEGELRGTVEFLVDTGAGASLLAYRDLLTLNIPPMLRGMPRRTAVGIGGAVPTVLLRKPVRLELLDAAGAGEPIVIVLDGIDCEDPDAVRGQMRSRSRRAKSAVMAKPSLLGWDALRGLEVIISYIGEKRVLLCESRV